jgi:glycosyltransferase involved in cell wall biosynthesis
MWQGLALRLGVGDRVQLLGVIPNTNVRQRMIEKDIIVVPSHYDYAEGLPNAIFEALASRTPLLISDHPAFANRLQSGENCLIFRAADASSLADRVATLLTDAGLFARLSARSAAALDSYRSLPQPRWGVFHDCVSRVDGRKVTHPDKRLED